MSLPELCIRRPVMTTLLMLSFIVFGIFGYFKLPTSALPRVDFPAIAVTTQLPGANPETMATSVVAPLERAFATILDSNVTTLIAAIVLFSFGSGPVKGFAISLSLGILTSMFTAVTCTRALVNLNFGRRRLKSLSV